MLIENQDIESQCIICPPYAQAVFITYMTNTQTSYKVLPTCFNHLEATLGLLHQKFQDVTRRSEYLHLEHLLLYLQNPGGIKLFTFPLYVEGVLHQIYMATDMDGEQLQQLKQQGCRMEATYVTNPGISTGLQIRLPPMYTPGDTISTTAEDDIDPLFKLGLGLARLDVAIAPLERA